MIGNIIKKLFSNDNDKSGYDLEMTGTDQQIRIAITTILIETVNADGKLSYNELKGIVNILNKNFDIDSKQSLQLIRISQKCRDEHPDIWYFTNIINEQLDKKSKYELIEMVWKVIYSDGSLDKYESSVSHKLRGLLHIEHSKFIEIKLKVAQNTNL